MLVEFDECLQKRSEADITLPSYLVHIGPEYRVQKRWRAAILPAQSRSSLVNKRFIVQLKNVFFSRKQKGFRTH